MSFLNKKYISKIYLTLVSLTCLSSCENYSFSGENKKFIDNFKNNIGNYFYKKGEFEISVLTYKDNALINYKKTFVEYDLDYYLLDYEILVNDEMTYKKKIYVENNKCYEEINGNINESYFDYARHAIIDLVFENNGLPFYEFQECLDYTSTIQTLAEYDKYFTVHNDVLSLYIPLIELKDKSKINFGFSVNKDGMLIDFHSETNKDSEITYTLVTTSYDEKENSL